MKKQWRLTTFGAATALCLCLWLYSTGPAFQTYTSNTGQPFAIPNPQQVALSEVHKDQPTNQTIDIKDRNQIVHTEKTGAKSSKAVYLTQQMSRVLKENAIKKGRRKPQSVNGNDHSAGSLGFSDVSFFPSSHINHVPSKDISTDRNNANGLDSKSPHYIPFLENLSDMDLSPQIVPSKGICDSNTIVLIAVCSSFDAMSRRQAIRETWGTATHNPKLGVSLVFILGQPDDKWNHLHTEIINESKNYKDILQWNFIDSTANLTLKTLGLLKWTLQSCPQIKFLMKTDDDVFINIPNLLQILVQSLHENKSSAMLLGYAIEGARPGLNRHSKWFTSDTVFREHFYPRYLSGSAYIISSDQVSALYNSALHTPPFWLEDVYITGILTAETGATLIHNSKFWYRRRKGGVCEYRMVVTGHELTPEDMYKVWGELHTPDLDCSSLMKYYH